MTRADPWIDWELRAARAARRRPGLVGVLLEPWCVRPKAMLDAGAIFVPFKRDAVERAIRWAAAEPRTSGDFELVDD